MERLTTDKPKDNVGAALNLFYIKEGWTWVRRGGPAPEYPDVSLCDYVRRIMATHVPYVDLDMDDDSLSMMLSEWLFDDPECMESLIAVLYTAAWAFSNLRHRLAAYEDTGLEPETIVSEPYGCVFYRNRRCNIDNDWCAEGPGCPNELSSDGALHLLELLKAEKDGRLVVLPCKVGDTVWTNFAMAGWYFRDKDKPCTAQVVFVGLNNSEEMGGGLFNAVYAKGGHMMQFRFADIGKTVFLTREEAEAALKGGADEQMNQREGQVAGTGIGTGTGQGK